jgi:hypothetical protein
MTMIADGPAAPVVADLPRPLERVEADLVELAGQLAAGTCRFLLLVGEYDAAEGWRSWGMTSTAAWLSWHCGVGATAAREQVRVARVMRCYPLVVAAFAAGRLSYSKVRAITRVVTEETVDTLVMWAEHATAAQIERVVAATRRVSRVGDARARKSARAVSWRFDDDGSLVGSFRLPPEDGIRLLQAFDVARASVAEPPGEVTGAEQSAQQQAEGKYGTAALELPVTRARRTGAADALLHLADAYLASSHGVGGRGLPGLPSVERCRLVVHASAEALAQPDTADDTAAQGATVGSTGGLRVRVHPSTARRLTCDCTYATQVDLAGTQPWRRDPLHLGRRTRRVRGRLAAAVHERDHGHCQAPGCTRTTTEIHHVRHWANGGPTCIANLISLCAHHHWLAHEGGWTIVPGHSSGWVFIDPERRHIPTSPPAAAPAGPLGYDAAIPANAITGHWDGSGLNLNNAISALLIDCQPAPTSLLR